jgi:RNA polymerase sigma-70 factor (ECF subfamily)
MHVAIDVRQEHAHDAALVRLALDDPAAFGELYQRYRTRIYWYLRARTSSAEDADDLTQHVFLAAFARLHQYRERKASFATWLFTVARNAAIDYHRRQRTTTDWDGLPAAPQCTDDGDLAHEVIRREAVARMSGLVATLPPEKRELLALHFAAELSIAELAAVIGKSPGATRMQLSRLLHSLEEQYRDRPDAP